MAKFVRLTTSPRYLKVQTILGSEAAFREHVQANTIEVITITGKVEHYSNLTHKIVSYFASKNVDVARVKRCEVLYAALSLIENKEQTPPPPPSLQKPKPKMTTENVNPIQWVSARKEALEAEIKVISDEFAIIEKKLLALNNDLALCTVALAAMTGPAPIPLALTLPEKETPAKQEAKFQVLPKTIYNGSLETVPGSPRNRAKILFGATTPGEVLEAARKVARTVPRASTRIRVVDCAHRIAALALENGPRFVAREIGRSAGAGDTAVKFMLEFMAKMPPRVRLVEALNNGQYVSSGIANAARLYPEERPKYVTALREVLHNAIYCELPAFKKDALTEDIKLMAANSVRGAYVEMRAQPGE